MADTLGKTLLSARRSLGLSLAEAEDATKIRAKLLSELEQGNYDKLPNAVYVRGYIISYARFLELDPAPLLEQYADERGEEPAPEPARIVREQVVLSRNQAHALSYRTAFALIALIALIAGAIWGISRFMAPPEEPAPLPVTPVATTTVAPEDAPPPIVTTLTPEATDTESTTPEGAPFTLAVKITPEGASWLRVTVDGLKAYEGVLTGGQSKEWDVTDEATVKVGQPTAVTISRDGSTVEIPLGETPEFTLKTTDTPQ